jgi:SH3-like domain-containing protein
MPQNASPVPGVDGVSRFLSLRLALCASLLGLAFSAGGALSPATYPAFAQAVGPNKSGLPIPRFVTLKSGRVNLRVGPGRSYPVEWMYLKSGLPVEVIQEYDNWRRIRDSEGTEGWINQSLLSGKRSGIAAPWFRGKDAIIPMRASPVDDARLVASVEPGAMGEIETCDGNWCQMRFDRYKGWVPQSMIWGAYPNETFED